MRPSVPQNAIESGMSVSFIQKEAVVVPSNMAGAGGNTAVGHVYSVAPKDGTYMVASSSGSLLDALIGDKSIVRHEPLRLQFIGSANSEVSLCILRKDAPAQSFAETLTKEVLIGSSGGTTRDLPTTLIRVLGSKMKLISGYPGTREVMLAMEKGEVHGICGIGYTSTISQRPDWLKPDSSMRAILQETIKGLPELDRLGIPVAMDFAKTGEQRTILEIIYSQLLFTRPFMMAPEVPRERVDAIRKAFQQALADPDEMVEVPGLGERGPRTLSRQALAAVIEPRVEELFSLVQQVVRESGYEELLSSGVVITGGASMMPGMVPGCSPAISLRRS